ncbi:hypothetical protein C0Q70_19960 [Pomacea canaliculata]|uniref:Uncharacterized protein n=1 Tax=Pomacea canaliculata TaxID=400727 RepID=A0A2T7NE80_POMCA|nr:hypothetical protein C0Q70_19960 [Pomacea canaliculata]
MNKHCNSFIHPSIHHYINPPTLSSIRATERERWGKIEGKEKVGERNRDRGKKDGNKEKKATSRYRVVNRKKKEKGVGGWVKDREGEREPSLLEASPAGHPPAAGERETLINFLAFHGRSMETREQQIEHHLSHPLCSPIFPLLPPSPGCSQVIDTIKGVFGRHHNSHLLGESGDSTTQHFSSRDCPRTFA